MFEVLPAPRRPERPRREFVRDLSATAAVDWLRAGWEDFRTDPSPSMAYGIFLVAVSYIVLFVLNAFGLLYLAFPATAGFLIIGPFLAMGLYEKSRRRMQGQPTSIWQMILVRPAGGAQLAYAGLFLCFLILFWIRAADLLYALFFGITPYPGAAEAVWNVLVTGRGLGLVIVGSLIGALFAALAFALSLVSIPMLMVDRRDALTAMGISFATAAQNARAVFWWGAIVAAGLALSVATGLLGLAIIFPILGHGTWHAYRSLSEVDP